MLNTVVAAAFEHMESACDIGLDISVGVVQRVADAGLRREMDDALWPLLGEHRLDHLALGQVCLDEMESVAALEPPKTGLFKGDIVIRAHIVEPNDLVAAVEQPGRRMETDEAGGAGNQNAHVVCSPLRAQANERGHKSHRRFALSTASGGQRVQLTLLGPVAIDRGSHFPVSPRFPGSAGAEGA